MIVVAGSTGVLGSEICRRLRQRGQPVRALVRATSSPDKVSGLRALGCETAIGDLKDRASLDAANLDVLEEELFQVNGRLWDVEDELRALEHNGQFGNRFVELARSVYRLNDQRSVLKRRINAVTGSAIVEEKSYTAYE